MDAQHAPAVRKRLIDEAERANPVTPVHVWQSPDDAGANLLVATHLSAYAVMHEHATAALPNETGGFLLGRVGYDQRDDRWHLEIDEAIPIEPEENDPAHFTFTWRDVDRVRTHRQERQAALIGWYHTHPGLGVFLSETDLERTHRVLFSEPFQIALVYDPVRGRAGYFFWDGPQSIDPSPAEWREFDIAPATPAEPEQRAAPASGESAPPDANDYGTRSVPDNLLQTARAAAPAMGVPPGPLSARSIALLLLTGAALVLVGIAMGYFWFDRG